MPTFLHLKGSIVLSTMDKGQVNRFKISIGGVDLAEAVLDATITESVNDIPHGDVTVAHEALLGGLEYRGEVVVDVDVDEPSPERIRLFTGQVQRVEPDRHSARLRLIGGMTELHEQTLRGLSTDRIPDMEIVWSILRSSGMSRDRIMIEGFEEEPLEPFEVAVPIDGLVLQAPVDFGGVVLTPDARVGQLAEGLQLEELQEEFTRTRVWAYTIEFSRTVYEAECTALDRIVRTVSRAQLRAHYSWSKTPSGQVRGFDRDSTRGIVAMGDVALVRGVLTHRRWLRAITGSLTRVPIGDAQLSPTEGVGYEGIPLQTVEAVTAWRRAAGAADSIGAVAALWDALEFYAAGVSLSDAIDGHTAREIRVRALEGLEGAARERVATVLGMINDPPLMVRIRAAADRDGAPLSDTEWQVLRTLRSFRNDFIHGRNRGEVERSTLRHGIGIVNRLLAFRLFQFNDMGF